MVDIHAALICQTTAPTLSATTGYPLEDGLHIFIAVRMAVTYLITQRRAYINPGDKLARENHKDYKNCLSVWENNSSHESECEMFSSKLASGVIKVVDVKIFSIEKSVGSSPVAL